jgi:hypothetical protein
MISEPIFMGEIWTLCALVIYGDLKMDPLSFLYMEFWGDTKENVVLNASVCKDCRTCVHHVVALLFYLIFLALFFL